MTHSAAFIYSNALLAYRFNEEHPFNQKRVLMTKELLESSGLLDDKEIAAPRMATMEELQLFHDLDYIDAVQKAGRNELNESLGLTFGLGTDDVPVFPNMHEAASYLVGGTLTAIDLVLSGTTRRALHLGGGLHHGLKRKASGFCVYNDGAIAIQYIREKYNLRVLYVDTDAHHGDGVQWAFYDDPNVCTFSIHETGRYLFPGTGHVNERGIKAGHGYSFNLPIDAFTQDESFLQVYEEAFRKIVDFFKPDIILTQNGVDAHVLDPLTHLCGTMKIYEKIPLLAHELAQQYTEGKWIAIGGGGYDMWRVVPRAWAQLWSVMKTGNTQSGDLPKTWYDNWQKESPVEMPKLWQDTDDIVPDIPRKKDITEKNYQTLLHLLKYTNSDPANKNK